MPCRHPSPGLWAIAAVCGLVSLARPCQAELRVCAAPWQKLGRNAEEIARPLPLSLLAGAALPPLLLSPTGWDADLRKFSQQELGGSYAAEPVTVATPYVALSVTVLAWGGAVLSSNCEGQRAPSAMVQGAAWTIATVALTKWIVGRTWPNGGRDPEAADRLDHPEDAQTFAPFRAGLAAFPSGHTAVMFSLAAALRASSPHLGAFRYSGYPLAAAVGFGMWYGDHHWASDVLSGALIGEALGGSAGRAWADPDAPHGWSVLAVPLPGGAAVGAVGWF